MKYTLFKKGAGYGVTLYTNYHSRIMDARAVIGIEPCPLAEAIAAVTINFCVAENEIEVLV